MRVVLWGTYDLGKPRVRILLRGLREIGVEVTECHREVWGGVEDKSQVKGWRYRVALALRWMTAYPVLICRYLRLPDHDEVLTCYLGHLDVLLIWPFARLRGKRIIWDAFLSLYDTVVEDRRMVTPRHPLAHLLYAWEWLSCHAADRVILDTEAHAAYFARTFQVPATRLGRVFVGAEPEAFHPSPGGVAAGGEFLVLFYGQFIPLHGIETIVRAARLCDADPIRWVLIGRGQEEARIERLIAELRPKRLERIAWVQYGELNDWIARADVCLGIFGTSDKAARVIPNKVFQILAAGKPLITRDSPAIRELLEPAPGIRLIAPGSTEDLAAAVREQRAAGQAPDAVYQRHIRDRISPQAVARQYIAATQPAAVE